MTNRMLLLVLVVLLAIWGFSKLLAPKKDRTFKTELIEVDTAAIQSIVLTPGGEEVEVTLSRSNNAWIASDGTSNVKAKKGSVAAWLNVLQLVKTNRIAAKKAEKWPEFELGDDQGLRIQVYDGSNKLEDFILGKFDFNPELRTATSYIRLSGENEVYATDGMPFITVGRKFDDFRDNTIIRMTREMEVTNFELQLPDTTLRFSKQSGDWMINESLALDSMKVENYLNFLRNISGETVAEDFDDSQLNNLEQRTLRLSGNQIATPFMVYCYTDTTRSEPFVIRSNQNPETYFSSDSSGIFNKFFPNVEELRIEND